ncbi:MAG TPA: UDP-N-acetylmuramoyl-L-alanine--D-glutamate ligase [Tepidisphaeraceae bacterium]|jgi:UDP-N-acetylmuramoylalanine--D-glutamate ligase
METDFTNKRVTVAGLGRFGGSIAAARWFCQQGAKVLVTDQEKEEKLTKSMERLADLPIEWRLGGHREEDFIKTDLVVASPAIPPSNPFLVNARNAGVPITTEMKLFIERLPSDVKTLAVTGTKGKSTTTTLLGMMLKTRYQVHLGGNIGKSLLFELPNIRQGDLVLLELSSFMLEYLRPLRWSPNVAVFTMISQDHLEWHGGLQGYLSAKGVLAESQGPEDFIVFNPENAPAAELAKQSRAQKVSFSGEKFALRLPGAHNQLNAQAAFAAARCLGIEFDAAQAAVRDFGGLPHRLELVHEYGGVRYFNDSIATIPEAAIAALNAFEPLKVIQIVGGYDKHLDRAEMIKALDQRAKAILCIGAIGPAIATELAAIRHRQSPPVHECGDLQTAMIVAKRLARPGDIVLLSTGFASYDQFSNFEERGNKFAESARQVGN